MKKSIVLLLGAVFFLAGNSTAVRAQQPAATAPQKAAPQLDEWSDDFSGDKLDETRWEKFTFEGGAGGKLSVKDGEVRIRSASRTRAGIRSKQTFSGERWLAEARLAKVGADVCRRDVSGCSRRPALLNGRQIF